MQPYAPPPARPARNRWLMPVGIGCGGLALILIVLGIIGAVFGPPEPAASPVARPVASSPAAWAGTPAPTPTQTRRERPAPTPEQAEAYLRYIGGIDPGLTVNRERALRRADMICDRIVNPPGGNLSLEEYTVLRLSGGNAQIDQGQARRIIKAVQVWCH